MLINGTESSKTTSVYLFKYHWADQFLSSSFKVKFLVVVLIVKGDIDMVRQGGVGLGGNGPVLVEPVATVSRNKSNIASPLPL